MPLPLRSRTFLRGLPDLSANERAKVTMSNRLADRGGQLQQLSHAVGIIGGEENPASSFLWDFPSRINFARRAGATPVVIDYCSFGTPFRARTRLLFWGHQPDRAWATHRCRGRGLCDFSKQPHERLSGSVPAGFKTKAKNAYPPPLCKLLASQLMNAVHRGETARKWATLRGIDFVPDHCLIDGCC